MPFSDPIEKYIKLSLCISNYIYVDLKSHVRFAMRIRLPLLRYSILLTTYMHSTLARRMHITNASSRIARPSQMRGKSSGVAAGSFECHGFSAIVVLPDSGVTLAGRSEVFREKLCIFLAIYFLEPQTDCLSSLSRILTSSPVKLRQ